MPELVFSQAPASSGSARTESRNNKRPAIRRTEKRIPAMAAARGAFKRARIKVASCFINLCRKTTHCAAAAICSYQNETQSSAHFILFPFGHARLNVVRSQVLRKRMNNKHGEFEQHLRDWLMAHDGERLDPVEICPGVKLVAVRVIHPWCTS